jgi:hypothetical protein
LHSIFENDAYFRETQKPLFLTRQIRKLLTGLAVPQEYCCLELEQMAEPLKVILSIKGNTFTKDVTDSHLFLGYKPLIIGFYSSEPDGRLLMDDYVCLSFVQRNFNSNSTWKGFQTDSSAVAKLTLKKKIETEVNGRHVCLYQGCNGVHSFLSPLYQTANNVLEKFRNRQVGNISLNGNLYDQVRIAYSIPRKISIITVSDGSLINMFPTDLHGSIDSSIYAGSLRIGGRANFQVESLTNVVISDVDASTYKQTYALGKNHMNDLQNKDLFTLHQKRSSTFNFPLPASALRYRELTRIGSCDHGIHRIHFYKIINDEVLSNSSSTLAHIQQYYAQWRINHGLKTKLYFR